LKSSRRSYRIGTPGVPEKELQRKRGWLAEHKTTLDLAQQQGQGIPAANLPVGPRLQALQAAKLV
jgi:hypothetical protein